VRTATRRRTRRIDESGQMAWNTRAKTNEGGHSYRRVATADTRDRRA
jgi:hypothetical protein